MSLGGVVAAVNRCATQNPEQDQFFRELQRRDACHIPRLRMGTE